jgi:hypothetical protein
MPETRPSRSSGGAKKAPAKKVAAKRAPAKKVAAKKGLAKAVAKKRVQGGVASTDLVLSSHTGENGALFAQILGLYVEPGALIADVTYGKGAFWNAVDKKEYQLLATDIQTGVDCRDLPYEDETLDVVVLDPPYMEGLYRKSSAHLAGSGTHGAFRENYSDSTATDYTDGGPKYHDKVLQMYYDAADEAWRVLRNYGVFIVKCQDEVSANRQHLTHVELINAFAKRFYAKDLFVLTRTNRPGISRIIKQEHARKNHSYFLVFIKLDPEHPKRIRPPKKR